MYRLVLSFLTSQKSEMNMDKNMDITARMSARLLAVADMMGKSDSEIVLRSKEGTGGTLRRFGCIADVGCDHGYVSICLVQRGVADRALAMDVRKGPLAMAEANIRGSGLGARISVRLSDGLKGLKAGEADGLVIAGMGGKLMISILDDRDVAALGIRMAVLQPQSDIDEFRRYLRSKGYTILDERVVLDEGKYYFPMLVEFSGKARGQDSLSPGETELRNLLSSNKNGDCAADGFSANNDDILRISDRYGVYNILRRDELLKRYLEHGREVANSIIATLDENTHRDRFMELCQELDDIELVLGLF